MNFDFTKEIKYTKCSNLLATLYLYTSKNQLNEHTHKRSRAQGPR